MISTPRHPHCVKMAQARRGEVCEGDDRGSVAGTVLHDRTGGLAKGDTTMKEEEPDDMPEVDNSTCIELSFRGKKYYLKCDRRQWILHRQRTWAEATDKKPAHWNYNGTSHFGRLSISERVGTGIAPCVRVQDHEGHPSGVP